MEVGPKRPHSQVLHCSPLRLNKGPPENLWRRRPGKRVMEGRGSKIIRGSGEEMEVNTE